MKGEHLINGDDKQTTSLSRVLDAYITAPMLKGDSSSAARNWRRKKRLEVAKRLIESDELIFVRPTPHHPNGAFMLIPKFGKDAEQQF